MRRTIARMPGALRGALGLVTAGLFALLGASLLPTRPLVGGVLIGLAALRLFDLARDAWWALRARTDADGGADGERDAEGAGGPEGR